MEALPGMAAAATALVIALEPLAREENDLDVARELAAPDSSSKMPPSPKKEATGGVAREPSAGRRVDCDGCLILRECLGIGGVRVKGCCSRRAVTGATFRCPSNCVVSSRVVSAMAAGKAARTMCLPARKALSVAAVQAVSSVIASPPLQLPEMHSDSGHSPMTACLSTSVSMMAVTSLVRCSSGASTRRKHGLAASSAGPRHS